MNNILKITKTELRILFYSPIAGFVLVAFLVQAGMIYLSTFKFYVTNQEMGGWGLSSINDLTRRIFSDSNGMLGILMRRFYIFIPLITMSLLSREVETGTIKLLYSSPVRIWQIVAGKYLSMLLFSLLMTGIVAVFMIVGLSEIQNADLGIFFPSILGLFLVLATYSAIGLFMSSLTRYQVVAAIATFLMIGALTYIGSIWQKYDFIRDLTYFLSIQGRAENLLNGLIVSRDLLYFLVVIFVFLGLTYFKLEDGLQTRPFLFKASRHAALIAFGLALGYLGSRPALVVYNDATRSNRNTITAELQQMLKHMDAPIEVITYSNALDNFYYVAMPENRSRLMAYWDRYLRFKPDFKFDFVFYYDQPADYRGIPFVSYYPGKTVAQAATQAIIGAGMKVSNFKTPAEIRKLIDLKPELNRYVMQLKYKQSSTFLRVFDDSAVMPSEPEMAAAIKRLLLQDMPHILFLTGNQQRSVYKKGKKAYQSLFNQRPNRFSLVNQGFDVDSISLNDHEIPSGISLMVIADPRTPLSTSALAKVEKYIANGGNLLIAGEPGRQKFLDPLLKKINITLDEGVLVQPGTTHTAEVITPDIDPLTKTFQSQMGRLDELFQGGVKIEMPGTAVISFKSGKGFKFKPLLFSDPDRSWLKKGQLVADSASVGFKADEGDVKGKFPIAVALTRNIKGKEQRIVVTGDADFMDNDLVGNADLGNMPLGAGLISWLHYGQFPINTKLADPVDNHLDVSFEALKFHRILFIWLLPALLMISGIVILIRRKRN